MADSHPKLAVIGGTGDLGGGLALRWAAAGYPVVIGSRTPDKAQQAAREFNRRAGVDTITGLDNRAAAAAGEIVVLTVPFANHRPMLEAIREDVQGKLLVDVTVPLVPPKVRTVHLPPEGSAAQAAQRLLGDQVRVVSAFQNVSADLLQQQGREIDSDVLVCGNDARARATVIELAAAAGLRAWHAGRLANAVVAEALTSVLIFVNQHYKIESAGIRITGLPASETAGN